jgi:ATP-dependent RNA helicase DeaD
MAPRLWRRLCSTPAFAGTVRPELVRGLQDMRIDEPNALQAAALPEVLAGRNIVCCAQTGSGKTLAFLLPLYQQLLTTARPRPANDDARLSRPEMLVLAPSRELAVQIADVAERLGRHAPPSALALACVTSGQRYKPQVQALRAGGVRVLVATPERLLYHLKERSVCLRDVRLLALDEARGTVARRGASVDA